MIAGACSAQSAPRRLSQRSSQNCKKMFKKRPQIWVHFMALFSRPPCCILDQRPQNQGHFLAPFLGPRFAPRGGVFVAPWVPKFYALHVKFCFEIRSDERPLGSGAVLYFIENNVSWGLNREVSVCFLWPGLADHCLLCPCACHTY